jgi:hypothetical protein
VPTTEPGRELATNESLPAWPAPARRSDAGAIGRDADVAIAAIVATVATVVVTVDAGPATVSAAPACATVGGCSAAAFGWLVGRAVSPPGLDDPATVGFALSAITIDWRAPGFGTLAPVARLGVTAAAPGIRRSTLGSLVASLAKTV